ncbi:MAG: response regulator [Chloroflexota bacterium]
MKILVLEDEPTSRLLIKKILNEFGQVVTTENGVEAVEAFRAAVEEGERYDLVFLDIMVPDIDGQEVLRRIRAIEEKAGLDRLNKASRIVMITALQDVSNVMQAFSEQCEAYIFKPFSKEIVRSTIEKLNLA